MRVRMHAACRQRPIVPGIAHVSIPCLLFILHDTLHSLHSTRTPLSLGHAPHAASGGFPAYQKTLTEGVFVWYFFKVIRFAENRLDN